MSNQISLLGKRRFLPFFATQFLGAFNDNLYKNAIIMLIAFKLVSENSSLWVNIAAGLFILPFFLFSALAGQIAEKHEKSLVLRICKFAEIPIMGLGVLGFYMQSPSVLVGALFLMGTQSAFFGPAKYSILPQHLKSDELIGGNGLVEMGTFVAILLGTMAGAYYINQVNGEVIVSIAIVLIACLGFISSLFIPKAPSNDPELKINLNPVTETMNLYRMLKGMRKSVYLSVLGISWFWFLGATYLTQIPEFTKLIHGDESVVTLLLVAFSIGIAMGSFLCERLSRNRVELGIVPLASIGLTVFGVMFYLFSLPFINMEIKPDAVLAFDVNFFLGDSNGILLILSTLMIGVSGGLYTVPLYALIQQRTPPAFRSRVIAANNILNSLFMVGSAIIAMVLLGNGVSVSELFLGLAIFNIAIALYIYFQVPEFFIRFVLWIITHSIYRVKHENIDNLPEEGPCVLVSNHVSYVDALLMAGAFTRPIRYVMYEPIYRIPVLNYFFKMVGAIPIDSQKSNPKVYEEAFNKIAQYLEDGEVVCIFPEGKLTSNGEIDSFKSGIELIVNRTPVPVLPVAIRGLWGSMFSRFKKLPIPRLKWSKVQLIVGDLVHPSQISKDLLKEKVCELRGSIQ